MDEPIDLIDRYKVYEKIDGEFGLYKVGIYGDNKEFEKAIEEAKNYLKFPRKPWDNILHHRAGISISR